MYISTALLLSLFQISYCNYFPTQESTELAELVDRHEATISKVKSIRSSYQHSFESADKKISKTVSGDYLRKNQKELYKQSKDGDSQYKLFDKSSVSSLFLKGKQGLSQKNKAFINSIAEYKGVDHVFSELFIDLKTDDNKIISLRNFAETYAPYIKITSHKDGNKNYKILNFETTNSDNITTKMIYWYDIEMGYLVSKAFLHYNDSLAGKIEIVEFSILPDGTKFPKVAIGESYFDNKIKSITRFELINPIFNSDISDRDLTIPNPPAGTEIIDQIQGVVGKSDGTWKITGPTRPFQQYVIPSQGSSESSTMQGEATKKEPYSYGTLFIIAAVACAILACLVILLRRYRIANI